MRHSFWVRFRPAARLRVEIVKFSQQSASGEVKKPDSARPQGFQTVGGGDEPPIGATHSARRRPPEQRVGGAVIAWRDQGATPIAMAVAIVSS